MKNFKLTLFTLATISVLASCSSYKKLNKSNKGAIIGTAGGAAAGAVIGKIAGNTALGTIIGAAVGGGTGAIIGRHMDKQAAEIKKQVPDAKVERVGEGIEVEFSSAVLFGFDQSALTTTANSTLNQLIIILNKYPNTNLEVQGHTDSLGTVEYNNQLSIKRATNVANYLTGNGIANSRITIKAFGPSAPKYTNLTDEGRQQNRRVEFLITANDQMKKEAVDQANSGTTN